MNEKDSLSRLLKSYTDPKVPDGFTARVLDRACAPPPALSDRLLTLRESGILCIAAGLALFIAFRTPVIDYMSALVQTLGGIT